MAWRWFEVMHERAGRFAGVIVSAATVLTLVAGGTASALPNSGPDTGSSGGYQAPTESSTGLSAFPVIDRIEPITDRWLRVFVQSPAMHRVMQVQVLLPVNRDRPRPTVYLLDGRGAPEDASTWTMQGHGVEFFADKYVNVVMTTGGPANLYTDWQSRDSVLGINKWETFLVRELPPLIDVHFEGNGRNAVQGVSMGAGAAMVLAARNRGLYRAVAAHSGCYSTAPGFGQAQARAIVTTYGGNPDNMFGLPDDPDWLAHDVLTHAENLRGIAIYLSSGSGVPGAHDVTGRADLPEAIAIGGPLEAGAFVCTVALAERLAQLDIPALVNLRLTGTHSWPYWAEESARAWPLIARALEAGT